MKKIITITVVGLLISATISPVFARTADEIRAEIKEIETKLTMLRKELASVEGQGNVWCYNFEQNMRIGDKNSQTGDLKEVLRREGLYTQKDARTDFDETLAAGVTAFQEKYRDEILRPVGLSSGTGYVGKGTRAKLNALYGCTRPPVSDNTIKEDSTTNQPPVIKSVKGPSRLSVGEAGSWIIEAYDPERASLRYSVTWGDEQGNISPSDNRSGATNTQTTTFTYSYARAGSYTVYFMVSDNAGQEVKSSMTIQVGEKIANGSLYLISDSMNIRVGQAQAVEAHFSPAMPPCPSGMMCAQVMPQPYRVDARFSVENSSIISLKYATSKCVSTSVYNYCGTYVSAEGKQVGTTKIMANWNGFSATMPVSVSQ